MWIPSEVFFTFVGSYVFVNSCENQSKNTTVRVCTDGHTDTLTD